MEIQLYENTVYFDGYCFDISTLLHKDFPLFSNISLELHLLNLDCEAKSATQKILNMAKFQTIYQFFANGTSTKTSKWVIGLCITQCVYTIYLSLLFSQRTSQDSLFLEVMTATHWAFFLEALNVFAALKSHQTGYVFLQTAATPLVFSEKGVHNQLNSVCQVNSGFKVSLFSVNSIFIFKAYCDFFKCFQFQTDITDYIRLTNF